MDRRLLYGFHVPPFRRTPLGFQTFGSPENAGAPIGLLNAVLSLRNPTRQVEILNPFSYQGFADDKLLVLDVCPVAIRTASA